MNSRVRRTVGNMDLNRILDSTRANRLLYQQGAVQGEHWLLLWRCTALMEYLNRLSELFLCTDTLNGHLYVRGSINGGFWHFCRLFDAKQKLPILCATQRLCSDQAQQNDLVTKQHVWHLLFSQLALILAVFRVVFITQQGVHCAAVLFRCETRTNISAVDTTVALSAAAVRDT